MLIYFLLALSPLVISYFFPKLNIDNKVKKRYLTICGIILILFIGLRSKYLGSQDSFNYYAHMQRALLFDSWSNYYKPDGIEIGFQLFVYLISRIFNSPQILFVITAIIYVVSILYCIYNNSDNVTLSVVMYITLGLMQFEMQGMRQAIAMSLCLFAFEFSKKKKLLPFILLVLLATSFHRTAILFVIVYVFAWIPYNWAILLTLGVSAIFVFSFSDVFMALANDIFDTDYAQTIDSGGFVATAIYAIIVIVAMLFYRNALHKKEDKNPSSIMYITLLGFATYVMRYFGAGISERVSFYFMFGQLLLLPNTITHLSIDYKKAVTIGSYVLSILLFLYRLKGSEFIPYEFFWNI